MTRCGVCHSDLHFWHGAYDMGGGKVMRLTDRGVELPRAPGHEIVGRVVAVGPEAEGVAIGDDRIVYPWLGCGECDRCRVERGQSLPEAGEPRRDAGTAASRAA